MNLTLIREINLNKFPVDLHKWVDAIPHSIILLSSSEIVVNHCSSESLFRNCVSKSSKYSKLFVSCGNSSITLFNDISISIILIRLNAISFRFHEKTNCSFFSLAIYFRKIPFFVFVVLVRANTPHFPPDLFIQRIITSSASYGLYFKVFQTK